MPLARRWRSRRRIPSGLLARAARLRPAWPRAGVGASVSPISDPTNIAPPDYWKGSYGKRAALREAVEAALKVTRQSECRRTTLSCSSVPSWHLEFETPKLASGGTTTRSRRQIRDRCEYYSSWRRYGLVMGDAFGSHARVQPICAARDERRPSLGSLEQIEQLRQSGLSFP